MFLKIPFHLFFSFRDWKFRRFKKKKVRSKAAWREYNEFSSEYWHLFETFRIAKKKKLNFHIFGRRSTNSSTHAALKELGGYGQDQKNDAKHDLLTWWVSSFSSSVLGIMSSSGSRREFVSSWQPLTFVVAIKEWLSNGHGITSKHLVRMDWKEFVPEMR